MTDEHHHGGVVFTTNWQKFLLLMGALGGMITLVITNQVEWADVSAPFGLIVGYATANGIGAARGQSPEPVFRPLRPRRRLGDLKVDADGNVTGKLEPPQE